MGRRIHRGWVVRVVLGACVASLAPLMVAAAELSPLRAQFEQPESSVDYADAKLIVDRLIDPSTDTAAVRRELDTWTKAVQGNIPVEATARDRLDALLKTLYQPGPWNQGWPFTYDLTDPLGKNPTNKRLATYLTTRKGNCVSMPILLAILGQRLDLPLTLATAPSHVLAKFADDTQQAWVNVEATAGGFKFDSSYEHETGITPTAIENGIYLRPLTPRESVGVIASTLMEHYAAQRDSDALMAVANMALDANPKDPVAMVWKANAYYLQVQDRYVRRHPKASDIPLEQQADYLRLSGENLAWFTKAEQLGWVVKKPEQEANYLQSIQREKARRGQ